MRRAASLLALGSVLALLHRATAGAPLEARATLALGVLLLAGWAAGAGAARAGIPGVSAYVVAGFALGPAWLGLVRRDELDALRWLGDAALAVLGLAAGAALSRETLRRERVALARLAAGAAAAPFAAVAAASLALGRWLPVTVHQPAGDIVLVALTLGAAAAVSSPAVTIAVRDALGAHGPTARTVLGVAVVKDTALVAALPLVLLLGRPLASPGALSARVAGQALAGFALALAAGTAAGLLAGLGAARRRRDGALAVAAAAFALAGLARLGPPLEPVLAALAAGWAAANLVGGAGDHLRAALRDLGPPASIAAFALAGATVHGSALARLWPWAVLLAAVRAAALRYGTRWAGRDPRVSGDLARDAWLGLISQAGLALGLAAVARRAFPEWGVSLAALIVAQIAIHAAAGPVCLRAALVRAGEAREPREDRTDAETPVGNGPVVAARRGL
jgi:Kef-type K+ transport system membrane component KefB